MKEHSNFTEGGELRGETPGCYGSMEVTMACSVWEGREGEGRL